MNFEVRLSWAAFQIFNTRGSQNVTPPPRPPEVRPSGSSSRECVCRAPPQTHGDRNSGGRVHHLGLNKGVRMHNTFENSCSPPLPCGHQQVLGLTEMINSVP